MAFQTHGHQIRKTHAAKLTSVVHLVFDLCVAGLVCPKAKTLAHSGQTAELVAAIFAKLNAGSRAKSGGDLSGGLHGQLVDGVFIRPSCDMGVHKFVI